ncbi:FHA domain-containing protein, partial [Bifidobacterium minimum]|uniref:FHA domain-containing protein n=1 Tax=Bifidobacterium minimum TaxID=1693 RepID=UPI000A9FB425
KTAQETGRYRAGRHRPTYGLHNRLTGQDVVLSGGVLLGRRPSAVVPNGVVPVRLNDPMRTISRNHAVIDFDEAGHAWIEDCGSLNGTFLMVGGAETRLERHMRMPLSAPCTIRIGDQFFEFTRHDRN